MIVISKIIVSHSDSLCGSVDISGSKNSALPIMAACLMIKGEVVLQNTHGGTSKSKKRRKKP